MTLRALASLCLVSGVVVGAVGIAHAMHMSTQLTPCAFSEDGKALLVRSETRGPEGGGSLSFEIWSTQAPYRLAFALSSDLSHGGSDHPQSITAADCGTTLHTLEQTLKKLGFRGVVVHPDRCSKRVEMVTTEERHTKDLDGARFRAKGNKLTHEDLEVRFRSTEIGIFRQETKLCSITQARRESPAEILVGGSKGGALVYILEKTSSGDNGLVGLCGSGPDGKLTRLYGAER